MTKQLEEAQQARKRESTQHATTVADLKANMARLSEELAASQEKCLQLLTQPKAAVSVAPPDSSAAQEAAASADPKAATASGEDQDSRAKAESSDVPAAGAEKPAANAAQDIASLRTRITEVEQLLEQERAANGELAELARKAEQRAKDAQIKVAETDAAKAELETNLHCLQDKLQQLEQQLTAANAEHEQALAAAEERYRKKQQLLTEAQAERDNLVSEHEKRIAELNSTHMSELVLSEERHTARLEEVQSALDISKVRVRQFV